jgi:hypothetical protein
LVYIGDYFNRFKIKAKAVIAEITKAKDWAAFSPAPISLTFIGSA